MAGQWLNERGVILQPERYRTILEILMGATSAARLLKAKKPTPKPAIKEELILFKCRQQFCCLSRVFEQLTIVSKIASAANSQEDQWAWAIGSIIWSMGVIEWLAIDWCASLGGAPLKDQAIRAGALIPRLSILFPAIRSANASEADKRIATTLWNQARDLADFRNTLSHNPIIRHQQSGTWLLFEANCFLGVGPRQATGLQLEDVLAKVPEVQALAARLDAERLPLL